MNPKQVSPHKRWPSGDSRPIVEIRIGPNEITSRFGISFEEDIDGLDFYQLAAVEDAEVGQMWLLKYLNDPGTGTVIYADKNANTNDVLSSLFKWLNLTTNDITWIAPN